MRSGRPPASCARIGSTNRKYTSSSGHCITYAVITPNTAADEPVSTPCAEEQHVERDAAERAQQVEPDEALPVPPRLHAAPCRRPRPFQTAVRTDTGAYRFASRVADAGVHQRIRHDRPPLRRHARRVESQPLARVRNSRTAVSCRNITTRLIAMMPCTAGVSLNCSCSELAGAGSDDIRPAKDCDELPVNERLLLLTRL